MQQHIDALKSRLLTAIVRNHRLLHFVIGLGAVSLSLA